MRFVVAAVLLSGLVVPGSIAAQSQSQWSLAAGIEVTSFSGGSRSLTADDETIHPEGAMAAGIGVARAFGRWRAEGVLDYLDTDLELVSPDLAVAVRAADFSRLRVGARLSRRVAGTGAAELTAGAGVFLEGWLSDDETRAVASAQAFAAFRISAGRLSIENGVALGGSRSPLRPSDVPDDYEIRGLRSVSLTARVAVGL